MAEVAAGSKQHEANLNGPGLTLPRFWITACVEKLWPQYRVPVEVVTAPAARSESGPSAGGVVPGGTVMLTVSSSTPCGRWECGDKPGWSRNWRQVLPIT